MSIAKRSVEANNRPNTNDHAKPPDSGWPRPNLYAPCYQRSPDRLGSDPKLSPDPIQAVTRGIQLNSPIDLLGAQCWQLRPDHHTPPLQMGLRRLPMQPMPLTQLRQAYTRLVVQEKLVNLSQL